MPRKMTEPNPEKHENVIDLETARETILNRMVELHESGTVNIMRIESAFSLNQLRASIISGIGEDASAQGLQLPPELLQPVTAITIFAEIIEIARQQIES